MNLPHPFVRLLFVFLSLLLALTYWISTSTEMRIVTFFICSLIGLGIGTVLVLLHILIMRFALRSLNATLIGICWAI